MMHPAADIRTLLQPGKRVHLAGIGGVSMCALAEVLQGMGLVVQGSDMTDSDTVRHLRSLGMEVAIGHSAENLKMGSLNFLQDMGVVIPEGTMVNQAVYAAIDGQLCAVFAISYAKMRSAAAGLVTLCGHRSVTPVILCGDFMLTESFLQSKFGVKTRRIVFPTREVRNDLLNRHPDPDAPTLAITTRDAFTSSISAINTNTQNVMLFFSLIQHIFPLYLCISCLGNRNLFSCRKCHHITADFGNVFHIYKKT